MRREYIASAAVTLNNKAIDELDKNGSISVIAHNLCDGKRKLLMNGKISGVIL